MRLDGMGWYGWDRMRGYVIIFKKKRCCYMGWDYMRRYWLDLMWLNWLRWDVKSYMRCDGNVVKDKIGWDGMG